MPSLQIRNLPDDVYQALALRAERAHRSLTQQALVELRKAMEGDRARQRTQILEEILSSIDKYGTITPAFSPEDSIREDRER
jgi:plasmid stability protein